MKAEEIPDSDAFKFMATVYEQNIPGEHITSEKEEEWFGDSGTSVHITNNDLGSTTLDQVILVSQLEMDQN